MTRRQRILRILLRIAGTLVSLAVMASACFALIIAQPQESGDPAPSQPPLAASSAVSAESESAQYELIRQFPVPVMSFMSGSGMVFVSGLSSDTVLPEGFGRTAVINWQTEDGEPVRLDTVYPASDLRPLKEGDYHFVRVAGPSLFGVPSVRMENENTVRLHVQTEEGLYMVTAPLSLAERLSAICQSLQLFSVSD